MLRYLSRFHLSYLHNLVHLHVVKVLGAHVHSLKRNKKAPHRAMKDLVVTFDFYHGVLPIMSLDMGLDHRMIMNFLKLFTCL